ncbi:MAG: TRAM domain-containing protein [Eubacteriales bacterium]|nr:TRAM domain-containing protein [Eubacteriales bacterium]
MCKKIARFFITLMGLFVGPGLVALVFELLTAINVINAYAALQEEKWVIFLIFAASGVISGIIFLFLSKPIVTFIFKSVGNAEKKLAKLPANVVIPAVIGLVLGLVVAYLLSFLVNSIPMGWVAGIVNVVIYIVCAYLGISILVRHRPDFDTGFFRRHKDTEKSGDPSYAKPKLLDTSVIIDGRIFDICNTGIIEGALIIPEFVLDELRHIADSADDLKRNRGRRGLDVLKRIQNELDLPVKIVHAEIDEATDVDSKLLYLAKDMDGIVVTNDYSLNKVAAVKSVRVLNINELANAVKPVVLPGEEMTVTVVKDGKEPGQGIAYLDDGTMIVVEGAKNEQNKPIFVIVTSVLQTAAGRMIFARIK